MLGFAIHKMIRGRAPFSGPSSAARPVTEPVRGDAWAPAIRDGDTVLIKPNIQLKDGEFVCARVNGVTVLGDLARRDEQWLLVDGDGGETLIDANVTVIGRVIGTQRRQ